MQTTNTIHQAVQAHYAARAIEGDSCCGADAACCGGETSFYSLDEVAGLPGETAGFSLGCGNAVSAARLQPGETVLDLGSGGGLECFIAARQVGAAGRVIGIDMTPAMLQRARDSAARMGIANVEFRDGFIEALPVQDASVDVVISNCVINLSPDKPAVLREMWRVLKPGGRIAISDVVSRGVIPEAVRGDAALWSACAAGALPVEEWLGGLESLGFEAVSVEANGEDFDWLKAVPEGQPFSAIVSAYKP
jgi:SAM-dependent methyltransferase